MYPLAERFRRLKLQVPGNREKPHYEWNLSVEPEVRYGIRGVNPHAQRALAQLEFAIRLSEMSGGRFDGAIDRALAEAERTVTAEGDLIASCVPTIEKLLTPLAQEAKRYTVLCVAHAHIDMNWLWGWPETVAATLDTFETMLRFLDRCPAFTFSQSQGAVYEIVERFDPEMMARIRTHIAQGRWEVTASSWVEQDKNMPGTEAMMRHLLYTKAYLRDHWGVDPNAIALDFSPDTFGHSANMPEILRQGGVRYYYHCRGYEGPYHLYRWRAPSGAEVIAYREGMFYNNRINPHVGVTALEMARSTGLNTMLAVYGVGDHGGGPTALDIERILEQDTWPIFPRFTFGTYAQYFSLAEGIRESLPVVDHALNFHAPGCYTTQTRIKAGNRHSEAALLDAEASSSAANLLLGRPVQPRRFAEAWRKVLFSHFHDILTGSCVREAREHCMGLYQEAQAVAAVHQKQAMQAIAARIDTASISVSEPWDKTGPRIAEGAGVGYGGSEGPSTPAAAGGGVRIYHLFNPLPEEREETVCLPVWDWEDDLTGFEVLDACTGLPLPCQRMDAQPKTYWLHQLVHVLTRLRLPSMGYATVALRRKPAQAYPLHGLNWTPTAPVWDRPIVLDNGHIRATFDPSTAALTSLIDLQSGEESLAPDKGACFHLVQEDLAMGTAWVVGRRVARTALGGARIADVQTGARDAAYSLEMLRNFGGPSVIPENLEGVPLRQGFAFTQPITAHSSITCRVHLDAGETKLVYTARVQWHDVADSGAGTVPQLSFRLHTTYPVSEYRYDVPGGQIAVPERDGDVPGLTYGAALRADGRPTLYLASADRYGYRGFGNSLSLTLIRAPRHPDPDPERGEHVFCFALGLANDTEEIARTARAFAHIPAVLPGSVHSGDLPPSQALLAVEQTKGLLTLEAVKSAEDDSGIVLRLCAGAEAGGEAVLRLPRPVAVACWVDALERPIESPCALRITDGALHVQLPRAAMGSLRITLVSPSQPT